MAARGFLRLLLGLLGLLHQRRDVALHADVVDQRAGGAANGRHVEGVPKGRAVLSVVQEAHCGQAGRQAEYEAGRVSVHARVD